MGTNSFPAMPVLQPDPATGLLVIRESCGLDHERQILTVACPAGLPQDVKLFSFRDRKTGSEFPAQRSLQNPDLAFIQLELRAGEEYRLQAHNQTSAITAAVTLSTKESQSIIS